MQGVFFVLYILVVSGLIAVVGDRVGYRIGKKRLTWFNLRPRDTAVLVAILTGMIISALTLASLLLLNRTLANALFNYERIVSYYTLYAGALSQKVEELETNLNAVTLQRSDAQERLAQLQEQLQTLTTQREQTEDRFASLTQQLQTTQEQLVQAQDRLTQIEERAEQAQEQVIQLQEQQQALEEAKQQLQQDRDQLERSLTQTQQELASLEEERDGLEQEIAELRQTAFAFRRGELGIQAGEILTTGVIQTPNDRVTALERQRILQQQVQEILAQAEAKARELGATPVPPLKTAVQIRKDDVAKLLDQVAEPGSWVVRILSISNRLLGEAVPVIANVNPNHQIFTEGTVLASMTIPPGQAPEEIQRDLLGLLSLANVRSREAGLLADPLKGTVGEFSQVKLLEVVQELEQIKSPTQVQVVTQADIYTAGPLSVSLLTGSGPELTDRSILDQG